MIIRVEVVDGDQLAQRIAEILANKLDKIAESDRLEGFTHDGKTSRPKDVRSGIPDHPGGDRPVGSDVYERESRADHGVPHQRGVRHGGYTDTGELTEEVTCQAAQQQFDRQGTVDAEPPGGERTERA